MSAIWRTEGFTLSPGRSWVVKDMLWDLFQARLEGYIPDFKFLDQGCPKLIRKPRQILEKTSDDIVSYDVDELKRRFCAEQYSKRDGACGKLSGQIVDINRSRQVLRSRIIMSCIKTLSSSLGSISRKFAGWEDEKRRAAKEDLVGNGWWMWEAS